ncbi:MAG TPA: energy-coupling factor transporter transmembrane component T [Coriobacteriia bacterium]|nr:energy-coupling factor transporter transmembrane component T [Coriobacteriia bacterium]
MDIGRIDSSAVQGRSWLHGAAPAAKLTAFALLLAAVVVSSNVIVVAGIILALAGLVLACRLPARLAFGLAAYPGLFAALYAFGLGAGPLVGALVVGKAVAAALCGVVLVLSTPYPQIFAPIQRFLPAVIGDVLLITYRSLFLLLERFGHVLTAARLRAGVVGHNPVRSAKLVTRSLGGVLLYSIDLSQRTYDVMHLRGYDGRLAVSPAPAKHRWQSASAVAGALVVAVPAIGWRVGAAALAPYAWLPAAAGLLAFVAGTAIGITRSKGMQ